MNSDGSAVDLDADPVAGQAERKRRLLRVGVPLIGVVLTMAVILTIATYAYQANRRGALALSDEILAALDARIAEQVADYFAPAKRAAVIARDLVSNEPSSQREELFEKFALSALKEISQITDLVLADGVIYFNPSMDITPAILTALQARKATPAPAAKPAAK